MTLFKSTALVVVTAFTLQTMMTATALAAEQKPGITRHPVTVEMEPAQEIPMVKTTKINWWWVALGVLVVGGIGAAVGGSSHGSEPSPTKTGSGTVTW